MDGRLYVLLCSLILNTCNLPFSLSSALASSKSSKDAMVEELQCLQVEMESAVRFFRHQEQFWHAKEEDIDSQCLPGHAAWAARQSAMWYSLAIQAESRFTTLLKNNPPPEFAKVLCPQSSR